VVQSIDPWFAGAVDSKGVTILQHTVTNNTVLVHATGNATDGYQQYGLAIINPGGSSNSNFVTFLKQSETAGTDPESLGAIESDGAGGVQFVSPEADYAEYIDKKDPSETFEPGDVVSVDTGKVDKYTHGRTRVLVISSAPIIAGNWDKARQDQMALTAFMGQVPVKVVGPVAKGDYLIPSGKSDGTAIAISPNSVVIPDVIIGQAWEASDVEDMKLIKAAIGFSFRQHMLASQIEATRVEVAKYRAETRSMAQPLTEKIKLKQRLLSQLKSQMDRY
jgi:hypothetical protein